MRAIRGLMILLAACLISGAASAAGDPAIGRTIAVRSCGGCHAVAEGQARPATDAAPPFIVLARDPSVTEASLRTFLRTPHPRMPSVLLSPDEADHIIAYLLRLRANY